MIGVVLILNHALLSAIYLFIFAISLYHKKLALTARDIQAWEYVPLGPFLGKSFGKAGNLTFPPLECILSDFGFGI
jgi:hypothetical protein